MAFVLCGDVPSVLELLHQRAREEARVCANTPHELPPLPFPSSLVGYRVLTDRSPNNTDELVRALCEAYEATPQLYSPANEDYPPRRGPLVFRESAALHT